MADVKASAYPMSGQEQGEQSQHEALQWLDANDEGKPCISTCY